MNEKICYLDLDGTIHAAEVFHSRDFGIRMMTKGRALFEWVPILVELLAAHPDVLIVLSTTSVAEFGLEFTKDALPDELARRIIGSTYTPENLRFFDAWPRGRQVTSDVQKRKPSHWLAIDDDPAGWPPGWADHLVLTDGATGISTTAAQNKIRDILNSWPKQSNLI
jgi:hypothetical protein